MQSQRRTAMRKQAVEVGPWKMCTNSRLCTAPRPAYAWPFAKSFRERRIVRVLHADLGR
jgi:hypothetical protein